MVNRLAFLFVILFLPFVIKAQGSSREPCYYQIKKYDTYSSIAHKYETKVDSLKKWNPQVEPERLVVGVSIIVGWEEVSNNETGESTESHRDSVDVDLGNTKTVVISASNITTIAPSDSNTNSDGSDGNPQKTLSWVQILIGLLIGLVLGVSLFYLIYVKKLKDDYKYLENELNQAKFDLNSEKTRTGSELSRLRSKIQSLEREKQRMLEENISLGEKIDCLKAVQSHVNENRMEESRASINLSAPQASESSSVLYADAIIDDYFVKVRDTSSEDSIFVLNLCGENSAYFTVYKPAYHRIVANPSFLDGCDIQILRDIMQLEIVSEGRAQRDASNGKWKVISKLNVIIK